MEPGQQKIVQYLNEAYATENALVRVLQSQIAMTPRGSYRSALETHLNETREHSTRVGRRLKQLREGSLPVSLVVGLAENLVGQALALGKTPLDLLRGTSGEEKVLKNAKDACATEALEIATYLAIERLARSVGDERTADLAASIRADEEKMLARILREIPKLTEAVVQADVEGNGTYDIRTTGAADAVRGLRTSTTAASGEPWPGYDGLTVAQIQARLNDGDEALAERVRTYERAHKGRAGVLRAAERVRAGSA